MIETSADLDVSRHVALAKGRSMLVLEGTEFFRAAARKLFVAVVTYLHRTADGDTTPTNFDLVKFVSTTDKREMYERLSLYPGSEGGSRRD